MYKQEHLTHTLLLLQIEGTAFICMMILMIPYRVIGSKNHTRFSLPNYHTMSNHGKILLALDPKYSIVKCVQIKELVFKSSNEYIV